MAELLGTSVASVNSALQRARARSPAGAPTSPNGRRPPADARPADAGQEALLARYVTAFERYDMSSLVALLHEEPPGAEAAQPFGLATKTGISRAVLPWYSV